MDDECLCQVIRKVMLFLRDPVEYYRQQRRERTQGTFGELAELWNDVGGEG